MVVVLLRTNTFTRSFTTGLSFQISWHRCSCEPTLFTCNFVHFSLLIFIIYILIPRRPIRQNYQHARPRSDSIRHAWQSDTGLWLRDQQRHWTGGEVVLWRQVSTCVSVDSASETAGAGDTEKQGSLVYGMSERNCVQYNNITKMTFLKEGLQRVHL